MKAIGVFPGKPQLRTSSVIVNFIQFPHTVLYNHVLFRNKASLCSLIKFFHSVFPIEVYRNKINFLLTLWMSSTLEYITFFGWYCLSIYPKLMFFSLLLYL